MSWGGSSLESIIILVWLRAKGFFFAGQNLRDVLTVSTQPVDKTVSKLIVRLSPSDGIQVLSFTRWNSTNLGCPTISTCSDGANS